MSAVAAVSTAPVLRQPTPVARPVDADGDNDGTTAAAAAAPAQPLAQALATSGSVGRNINTTA